MKSYNNESETGFRVYSSLTQLNFISHRGDEGTSGHVNRLRYYCLPLQLTAMVIEVSKFCDTLITIAVMECVHAHQG